jgi:hypothetical protein
MSHTQEDDTFRWALDALREPLRAMLARSTVTFDGGLRLHSPSVSATYRGIWPDDFLYAMLVQPGLYTPEQLTGIAQFLTHSIADLECVPDRVEADGMPVMQPGGLRSPHALHMPLHLPAAWVRLLDYLEQWGAVIPRKDDWARVIQRSIERVPFACGLAYIDPQHPGVGFGFHDPEAITGFELMSSLVLQRGLERAARLFAGCIEPAVIARWARLAAGIRANLYRLFDEAQGAFLAGSKDCRQVNVWANGLAYWMVEPALRARIGAYYLANREHIFHQGFTRQIAEPGGWQRHLAEAPVGHYTNGGYWAVGTGWVLPALADQDRGFAAQLAREFVQTVTRLDAPEWITADGSGGGASGFIAALAMPLMALQCVLEQRPLSDFF